MRISDWNSDVCSSDLSYAANERGEHAGQLALATTHTQARYVLPAVIAAIKREFPRVNVDLQAAADDEVLQRLARGDADFVMISTAGAEPTAGLAVPLYRWRRVLLVPRAHPLAALDRSDEHTSELQSLMRISYAVFCLKKN